MPPKKYADKSYGRPRLADNDGNDYLAAPLREFGSPPPERRAWKAERADLFMPTKNGYRDPLSVLFVTDLLLRLEHDHVLRAKHLTEMLKIEYPQVIWDPVTVGRIMGSIAEAGSDIGAFEKTRTSSGMFLTLRLTPNVWNWLMSARKRLTSEVQTIIDERRAGIEREGGNEFPWECFDIEKEKAA